MSNFKPKTTKKINVNEKNNITLDRKHNEITNMFFKEEELLPKLIAEKKMLKIKILNKQLPIDKILDIKDKILDLKQKILKIKSLRTNYYLQNSSYIFDYFEKKKNITCNNKVKINTFFNKCGSDALNTSTNTSNEDITLYLQNIDESFFDINSYIKNNDICEYCNKGELIPIDHEGILVCNICSINTNFLVENEKPSYKEPPKEVCFYAYKRINHFREILAQFQAKESTLIPLQVIEDIKNQIKKERIILDSSLTNKKTKDILKKLGYNKYYEHIPFIKDKLGIKPPIMCPELEETLCNLFMDIQTPYAKFCPDDRVNFLNYYYTIYKLCELLDQTHFLPHFPMLKDREKRIEQDIVWKQICEDLKWEYIPTI